MSNSTISISFKLNGDTKSFQMMAKDAELFGRAMKGTMEQVRGTNSEIVKWSNLANAAHHLSGVVTGLQGAFKGLTDAYAVQVENESRLATAMRNTMGASDAEIQAIKDLAAEQQRLGVVGDEVALSGAQKLASFLTEQQSLKALVPLMNDLVVQQYGVKASAEGAASVATLLGKAMSGQVGALTRYGYSFTEAQEAILKTGTESEKAAVLLEVVGSRVGGMNAELAKTPTGRLVQMNNTLGDMRETMGGFVQGLMPALTGLSSLVNVCSNGMRAFSSLKAVLTSFGKAFSGLFAAAATFTSNMMAANAALVRGRLSGESYRTTMVRLTRQLGSATAATKAMRAAMGGWVTLVAGAAIAALGVFIKKKMEARRSAQELAEAQKSLTARLGDMRSGLELDIAKLRSFNGTQEEAKAYVDELNGKYKDAFGTYSTLSDWYGVLSANVDLYCSKLAKEIQMEELAAKSAQLKIKSKQLKEELASTPRTRTFYVPEGDEANGIPETVELVTSAWHKLDAEAKKTEEEIKAVEEELAALVVSAAEDAAKLSALAKPSPAVVSASSGSGEGAAVSKLSEAVASYRQSVERAVEVNSVFGSSADAADIRLDAMRSGIESLIKTYGLESEAVQSLIEEYRALVSARGGSLDSAPIPTIVGSAHRLKPSSTPSLSIGGKSGKDGAKLVDTDNIGQAQEAIEGLSSALSAFTGVLGENASSWASWGANLLSVIGRALPALIGLFAVKKKDIAANTAQAATGAAAAVASTPVVGPIMAVSAVASVLASLLAIPKFAKGGLAYGPTLGLFGEYSGASTNPEVVAPLDRLRSILGVDGRRGGEVSFKIKGRDLYGVLAAETNYRGRM